MAKIGTDGYGMPVYEWLLSDPPLQVGWRSIRRQHTEEGEHVWQIVDQQGREFRWLEDENGPEWAYRQIIASPER